MQRIGRGRVAVAVGALMLVGGMVVGMLPASAAGTKAPKITASPRTKLTSGQTILIRGSHLNPGDEILLLECQRTAALPTDCDLLTTVPVKVVTNGQVPVTDFPVQTGLVGTGTCGTSKSDANDCEIVADDLSSLSGGLALDTFVAFVNISFKVGGTTTTTLPTIPTTLPTLPTTLPTLPIPTTLPTLPTTLPTLPTLSPRHS
jgi:hypothetical protein